MRVCHLGGVLAGIVALAISGCGGNSSPTGPSTAAAEPSTPTTELGVMHVTIDGVAYTMRSGAYSYFTRSGNEIYQFYFVDPGQPSSSPHVLVTLLGFSGSSLPVTPSRTYVAPDAVVAYDPHDGTSAYYSVYQPFAGICSGCSTTMTLLVTNTVISGTFTARLRDDSTGRYADLSGTFAENNSIH